MHDTHTLSAHHIYNRININVTYVLLCQGKTICIAIVLVQIMSMIYNAKMVIGYIKHYFLFFVSVYFIFMFLLRLNVRCYRRVVIEA